MSSSRRTRKTTAAPAQEAAGRPEPVVTVERWAQDRASQRLPGRDEARPPYELLGGFVAKMQAEGHLAARASAFDTRWKAFLAE